MTSGDARTEQVERLLRWERSGGVWRVLQRSEVQVTVGLFTCDGGAEMDRLSAAREHLDAFLAGRTASDE